MTERTEVERAISSATNHPERLLFLAALLTSTLRNTRDPTVVVGGSAIEIYTSGKYVSGDLDLVASRREAIRALEAWGFKSEGRIWWHPDWKLAIDLVGPGYNGSLNRTQTIQTRFGPVRLAAVEDLLVKRLAEAKHFQRKEALDQAVLLASEYRVKMDGAYLDEFARKQDVLDILQEVDRKLSRPRRT